MNTKLPTVAGNDGKQPAPFAPIISNASDVPILIRIRDIILTIILWIAYVYFMRDFFDFIVDVYHWALNGFDSADNYKTFAVVPTMLKYLLYMCIFGALYVIWAKYNQVRFRGKNRRRANQPITVEQIAKLYNIDPESVKSWQSATTLTMHHDVRGYLTKVELG